MFCSNSRNLHSVMDTKRQTINGTKLINSTVKDGFKIPVGTRKKWVAIFLLLVGIIPYLYFCLPTNFKITNPEPKRYDMLSTRSEMNISGMRLSTGSIPARLPARLTKLKKTPVPFLTSPKHSNFKVSSKVHQLCDTLQVHIYANNIKNKIQSRGGDFFLAWIYNEKLRASSAADVIIDHNNGSYTANFRLRWAGINTIAVNLVHSSDAVSILTFLRDKYPARCSYSGKFQSRNITEVTPCHISTDMYLNKTQAQSFKMSNGTFCNFTDEMTGFPWFCIKPDILPCDTFSWHVVDKSRIKLFINSVLSKVQLAVVGQRPHFIASSTKTVNVKARGRTTTATCEAQKMNKCSDGLLQPRPPNSVAGFYYKDQWQSLLCKNRHFKVPKALTTTRQCLKNHTLHFWGDSTLRQWYEYFADVLKKKLIEHKANNTKFGPHLAVDKKYNIRFDYRHHGFPIRNSWTLVNDIHYVPNMIDGIENTGGKEVILLSLWAHFTGTDLQFYRQRWLVIKAAIARLKQRNQGARIVIKSANTRELGSVDSSNWYANEMDKVMREVMSGIEDVAIIDVWDMTIGHRTGYRIHPKKEIVSQEIDMLLSFLCP